MKISNRAIVVLLCAAPMFGCNEDSPAVDPGEEFAVQSRDLKKESIALIEDCKASGSITPSAAHFIAAGLTSDDVMEEAYATSVISGCSEIGITIDDFILRLLEYRMKQADTDERRSALENTLNKVRGK